ncbi:MAG: hypothetical protein EXR72_25425 [Myxococcales bacterium]|nr:hypothetical protein [Myxococcales bacterium]
MKAPVEIAVEVDVIQPATPSLADQQRRKLIYFVIANLLSLVLAAGIFYLLGFGIAEGSAFDHAMGGVQRFFSSHMGIAALAASTPFFASLLVGQYEMRRARARRKRNEATERRAETTRDLATEDAMRAARRAVKH